jgi:hypothetical protein
MQWVFHKRLAGSVNLKRVELPLKATPAQEANKQVMLLACFYSEGIVHHENVSDGQTINKEFYLAVL